MHLVRILNTFCLFFYLFFPYFFFISIYFDQILYTIVFLNCPTAGMQKGDKASPSIILAGQALLVKMLIPLEPCAAFGSNFVYLCI